MTGPPSVVQVGEYTLLEPLDGHDGAIHDAHAQSGVKAVVAAVELSSRDQSELLEGCERARGLRHPAVLKVADFFESEGKTALVFDPPAGVSLGQVIGELDARGEHLRDGAALKIGLQLCEALHMAHGATDAGGRSAPLLHAELGAHQVFLTPQGAVRLLGLGLTEAYYRALRRGPQPSPEVRLYLPPERWGPKPLTPRANVFSVAAILWRLLSHVPPPAPGEPFPLLRMVRPDLPVRLVSAIDRALERTLLRRRITCIELARVLQTSRLADPAARRWGIGWLNDLVPVALERGPATLPAAAPAPWELRTLPPIDGPDSDVGPSREASLPPAVVPAIPGPAPVPRIADQILDDYDW